MVRRGSAAIGADVRPLLVEPGVRGQGAGDKPLAKANQVNFPKQENAGSQLIAGIKNSMNFHFSFTGICKVCKEMLILIQGGENPLLLQLC